MVIWIRQTKNIQYNDKQKRSKRRVVVDKTLHREIYIDQHESWMNNRKGNPILFH
jgi:hypothetical protein